MHTRGNQHYHEEVKALYLRRTQHKHLVSIGHEFFARTVNATHLEKHNLLGRGPLAFVNDLCVLVDEKKEALPSEEWNSLEATLHSTMLKYETGELYGHLFETYGPDAINYNAWVHFSIDTEWNTCLRVIKDMPTEILEQYAPSDDWTFRRSTEDYRAVMKAIGKRTDSYGSDSLPQDMVEGILFNTPV